MSGLDSPGEAIGEGTVVVLREINCASLTATAWTGLKVYGAQEMGSASRISVPDTKLPLATIVTVTPGALVLRVRDERAISVDAGDAQFPVRHFLRKTRAKQHR